MSTSISIQKTKSPHSILEKLRRERINECVSQLKDLVPECRGSKKLQKLEILEMTVQYIRDNQSKWKSTTVMNCVSLGQINFRNNRSVLYPEPSSYNNVKADFLNPLNIRRKSSNSIDSLCSFENETNTDLSLTPSEGSPKKKRKAMDLENLIL